MSQEDFNPIRFRHHLHRYPELSLNEYKTASEITDQLLKFGLAPKTNIGGHGIIVEIVGEKSGPTTLFRADFDALPINEKPNHSHGSRHSGCMHACGHDGHTTSLLQLANILAHNPPASGTVVLLFQPAEEIGLGAKNMLLDIRMQHIKPDAVFAYHNLPGYPLGEVVIKNDVFACASTGVNITFNGKTSHAAYPEHGISPAPAVNRLMDYLDKITQNYQDNFNLITLVHVKIGNEGYGTSPGKAQVMATLRSDDEMVLAQIQEELTKYAQVQAELHHLDLHIEWIEPFAATINNRQTTDAVRLAANTLHYSVKEIDHPLRWSEDVGEFLHQWPGTLFCIGSGEAHPQLHNPDYDFPDELIEISSQLFLQLIRQRHGLLY
ncbi:amidohydrolase [Photobacterium damselae subsp. damselae]|uniref:amidohydrolase n=1 Tax=Photobacterium damselae TaxID=38293 RepID=UPI000A2FB65E|nr:amidohydrolase [Photobacterium damselae]ARR50835.1 peptidase M20 [Photobacterium damselae subsp. damselae]QAY37377.1 amidohydrolase [Photobacterium damselae subsp. damselae]QOQ70876.1 amidohydrolase [Photobacterium damselae subsp. damselae]